MSVVFNEIGSNSWRINGFNDEYDKLYPDVVTSETQVIETKNILNREYSLLFVWFIIAIIAVIFTTFTIFSNELNSYILYPALGFLIFIIFYIFKNIYIYFNDVISNK